MALVSTFLQMLIALGMYNFDVFQHFSILSHMQLGKETLLRYKVTYAQKYSHDKTGVKK